MTTATDLPVRVSEIFVSIQGEGPSVGTPSVFVRLQGCTVGCTWCDTKYSWDPRRGREIAFDMLLDEVKAAGTENVVITGGEPLEHPAFASLVTVLKVRGHRVEVETAGTDRRGLDWETPTSSSEYRGGPCEQRASNVRREWRQG